MSLTLLTPPAVEPVSLAELKEFLRVDAGDTSQDGTIAALATEARGWAEAFTWRRFVQQTWRVQLDFFPGYYAKVTGQPGSSAILSGPALLAGIRFAIVLFYPPVQSIVAFQYENANGIVTVLNPATDYLQDLQSNPARLTPPFSQMWPVARVVLNAVQIDYTVGYAIPLLVSSNNNPRVITSNYLFQASDVGRPISILGAGANGGTLNTVVSMIGSPPGTILRDPVQTGIQEAPALLVNNPNCNPAHWGMIKSAILLRTEGFWRRQQLQDFMPRVKDVLTPVRDLRK
jgi:hypothetical protein